MVFTVRHDYYAPMRAFTKKQFYSNYPPRPGNLGFCRALLLLWVLLLLGACSSLRDSWEIHARSAIFVNEEVYQVGINWQREQNRFILVLEAPLGQGVFRVESYPANGSSAPVMLTLPDGQRYFNESAEALLLEVLGWSIPVSGLEWWIKGLPLGTADYSFDLRGDGRLKSLLQNDWKINYLDYFDRQSPAQGLPRKMYLKHQDLALKIVIERWHQYETPVDIPVLFPEFD
jgi:outer membrane lipoprotein LolB